MRYSIVKKRRVKKMNRRKVNTPVCYQLIVKLMLTILPIEKLPKVVELGVANNQQKLFLDLNL